MIIMIKNLIMSFQPSLIQNKNIYLFLLFLLIELFINFINFNFNYVLIMFNYILIKFKNNF